jgi:hypothetical protein
MIHLVLAVQIISIKSNIVSDFKRSVICTGRHIFQYVQRLFISIKMKNRIIYKILKFILIKKR